MLLTRLVVRAFRNLVALDLGIPAAGMALIGRNGQGKTNLLEAIYYPVTLRSFRGASDAELAAFGGTGFRLHSWHDGAGCGEVEVAYATSPARKQVACDGIDEPVLARAIGRWLAVVFVPGDVALAGGPATERRRYLDRMLSLADGRYLHALTRYRHALAQRNAALRQGRSDVAQACEVPLAQHGAVLVRARAAWCEASAPSYAAELAGLGEGVEVSLAYRGRAELADTEAWPAAFRERAARDGARGLTSVGPHRDDVALLLEGRALRTFGSTGQLRSAAIALKLLELETLRAARATEPALVLDDVFAELDGERQRRLAARLGGGSVRQCFVSAPRADELPPGLGLPRADVEAGTVQLRDEMVA